MNGTLLVYKSLGITPFDVIKKIRARYPQYASIKIAYAGRLDPMAEGLLLLLLGDTCKERERFERLSKKYSFTALFGIESDTYDILGLVKPAYPQPITHAIISALLPQYCRTFTQEYPPFSSARVDGKPLFYWARHNLLHTITIPKKKVSVNTFTLDTFSTISTDELQSIVTSRIMEVVGDFRQQEILASWEKILPSLPSLLTQVTCTISCSSGTYIRSLVHDIGKKLNTGALTLSLKRTRIGDYKEKDTVIVI